MISSTINHCRFPKITMTDFSRFKHVIAHLLYQTYIRSKPYFILKIYILNDVKFTSQIKYTGYRETKRNLLEVVLTESLLTE